MKKLSLLLTTTLLLCLCSAGVMGQAIHYEQNFDNLKEGDPPRAIVVDALAGREVLAQAKAPDGYQLESRSQSGPGIVGDVFGMNRYDSKAALVNRGRVIPITLPVPYQNQYFSPVYSVGWLVDDGPR